jgi:omega-amidase
MNKRDTSRIQRRILWNVIFVLILPAIAIAQPQEDTTGIRLRVAAGQFRLEPDLEKNLHHIECFVQKASDQRADLIVFPELALTGYPPKEYETIDYIVQEKTEKALEYLKNQAKIHELAVAVGVGWQDEKNLWRNRAFFIDEHGDVLAYYDKIQQTSHERKFFVDGERLPVFQWKGVQIGMLICMDMRYPELWRLMRKQGAQLMLHLSAAYGGKIWKRPVLEGTMRCRAAESGFFIVSCNNAGPEPMMTSAIYNPRGLILADVDYGNEELIIADIDINELEGFVNFKDNVYRLINTAAK